MAIEVVSIEPACIDIRVQRGTDNTFEFVITDGEGRAADITADDVIFTIKDGFNGATIFQDISSAGGHLEAGAGKVEIIIARTDIDDEANATVETFWVYEVRRQIGGSGGEEHVHIKGEFIVEPSVGI